METAVKELGLISGQRPVTTKAKKSIANFKVCLLYTSAPKEEPKAEAPQVEAVAETTEE